MKKYELNFLTSSDLSDVDLKNLSDKICNFIQEEGGVLDAAHEPLKKRLGYAIKNNKFAHFVILDFSAEPSVFEGLEKKLRDEKQILRYMILSKKLQTAERPRRSQRLKETQEIKIESEEKIEEKPKEKVELKEIEKKLEEILGE